MDKPILYIFNISHFCEKARWALDHCGVAHRVQHVMVGTHRRLARKLGAASGSVPFLQAGDRVIAGSSAIIDWADTQRRAEKINSAGLEMRDHRHLEIDHEERDRRDRQVHVKYPPPSGDLKSSKVCCAMIGEKAADDRAQN